MRYTKFLTWLHLSLCLLFVCSGVSAQTEFGNNSTTYDVQETSTVRAWALVGSSYTFTASSGDEVTELYAYLKSYNAGDFTFDIGIYEVSSGVPTNLVGSVQTVTGNGASVAWYGVTGLSISLTAGTEYCIAVGALTNGARLHENTGVANDQSVQTSSETLGATWNQFLQYAEVLCAYGVYANSGGSVSTPVTRRRRLLQGDK